MVIDGMSRKEILKLRKSREKKEPVVRRKRAVTLSDKTMKNVLKKFDKDHDPDSISKDEVNIDSHVKMNDSYMRTGWYVPKKK